MIGLRRLNCHLLILNNALGNLEQFFANYIFGGITNTGIIPHLGHSCNQNYVFDQKSSANPPLNFKFVAFEVSKQYNIENG